MHPSSLKNMKIAKDMLNLQNNLEILDVGGRAIDSQIDRSYKSIFVNNAKNYFVSDIVGGFNVTHVMPGPYTLPFDSNFFDLVVSGQTFEHVKNPFKLMAEIKRVLKINGFIIIIAPSSGRKHDDIDCWRFMDDSFKAIAEDIGGIEVIADWVHRKDVDDRSKEWQDHTFVGKKIN